MQIDLFPDRGNGPYRLLRAFSQEAIQRLILGCQDPERAQEDRLREILAGARETAFAKDHGMGEISNLRALRERIPIRTYDQLRPYLDRVAAGEQRVLTRAPVLQLLKTSGTTGASKLLPVTAAYEKEVSQGQSLWRLQLVRDYEVLAHRKALSVVSPAVEGRTKAGIPFGSNTGRMYARQPWVVRWRYPAPPAILEITDPRARLYALLRFALEADIASITTANPSTLLRLSRALSDWREELSGDLSDGTLARGPAAQIPEPLRRQLTKKLSRRPPPAEWLPAQLWDLVLLNCWKGGPAPFFLEKLPAAIGAELPVRDVGVTASEGYFAIPLDDGDSGGLAWLGGHLLEFIDEGGEARFAWELEEGRRYRLVITTGAGLYRYDLDDILEVTGHVGRAPVLRFVRKASNLLNITGEKLTEDQICAAARACLPPVAGFTAAHLLSEIPAVGLAVEGLPAGADLSALSAAFDRALIDANIEYAEKRASDRLAPARVVPLPEGTYARYRAARVADGAPDTQLKDPIVLDPAGWARLTGSAPAAL